VPASTVKYRSSVGDGADDVDGVKVFVVGSKENEGFDDGVEDHDEVKSSQIGLESSLIDPVTCLLK